MHVQQAQVGTFRKAVHEAELYVLVTTFEMTNPVPVLEGAFTNYLDFPNEEHIKLSLTDLQKLQEHNSSMKKSQEGH